MVTRFKTWCFEHLLWDESRRLGWAGHVARMKEGRSDFKILTGKPAGKRPLRRHRRGLDG